MGSDLARRFRPAKGGRQGRWGGFASAPGNRGLHPAQAGRGARVSGIPRPSRQHRPGAGHATAERGTQAGCTQGGACHTGSPSTSLGRSDATLGSTATRTTGLQVGSGGASPRSGGAGGRMEPGVQRHAAGAAQAVELACSVACPDQGGASAPSASIEGRGGLDPEVSPHGELHGLDGVRVLGLLIAQRGVLGDELVQAHQRHGVAWGTGRVGGGRRQ